MSRVSPRLENLLPLRVEERPGKMFDVTEWMRKIERKNKI